MSCASWLRTSALATAPYRACGNRTLQGHTASKRVEGRLPPSAPLRSSILHNLGRLHQCATRLLAFNLNTLVDSKTTPLPRLHLSQNYQSRGYSSKLLYARAIEQEIDRRGNALHKGVAALADRPWSVIQTIRASTRGISTGPRARWLQMRSRPLKRSHRRSRTPRKATSSTRRRRPLQRAVPCPDYPRRPRVAGTGDQKACTYPARLRRAALPGSRHYRRIRRQPRLSDAHRCVRPVGAVHMIAGRNAFRESGPGRKPAFEIALAHVGCPDRRIDRFCITRCSPS